MYIILLYIVYYIKLYIIHILLYYILYYTYYILYYILYYYIILIIILYSSLLLIYHSLPLLLSSSSPSPSIYLLFSSFIQSIRVGPCRWLVILIYIPDSSSFNNSTPHVLSEWMVEVCRFEYLGILFEI